MKSNGITEDGTKADKDVQPIELPSADIEANPMLAAVLNAIIIAYLWVREDTFIGIFWDEWMEFIIPVFRSKKHYNKFGLFTIYPIILLIAFCFSFLFFIVASSIAVILGTIGYCFIGIIILCQIIFMKREVSKNCR